MTGLRWLNIILAFLATLAPMAHVLELPNKLALDGPAWLFVQQHLYRGWGPIVGAPTEIGALATSLLLLLPRFCGTAARGPTLFAAACYVAMLAAFFIFNAPVNAAVAVWTAATLPSDWPSYRLWWESGHALSALLSLAAFAAVLRACIVETRDRSAATR